MLIGTSNAEHAPHQSGRGRMTDATTITQRSMSAEMMLDGQVRLAEESVGLVRHVAFRGSVYIWATVGKRWMYICIYEHVYNFTYTH